ncbi:MAG: hypothetical protein J6D37_01110 [Clostridia bacterium]|nr:hypothetical protein [Clostridia bacterium]
MEQLRYQKNDWIRAVFALSAGFFSLLTSRYYEKVVIVLAFLMVAVAFFFLDRRYTLSKFPSFDRVSVWIFTVVSLYLVYRYYLFCVNVDYLTDWKTNGLWVWIFRLAALLSLPFVFFMTNRVGGFLLERGKRLWKESTAWDKGIFFAVVLSSFALSFVLCSLTSVFTNPQTEGFVNPNSGTHEVWFDVLFTSDSGHLYVRDAFWNPSCTQNDIRQPFFALLSLPFSLVADAVSLLPFQDSFGAALLAEQMICVYCSGLLMAGMLNLKGFSKYAFVFFYCSVAGNFLFAFILEQYAFSVFYLLLGVSCIVQKRREGALLIPFAAGGLATTVLMAPMATEAYGYRKSFQEGMISFLTGCLKMAGIFLLIMALFGQLTQLAPARLAASIKELVQFTGEKVAFFDIFCQYTHFVANLFSIPALRIATESLIWEASVPSLQLNVPTSVSVIGIVLFVEAVLAFVCCRKERFAGICAYWILCSLAILLVLGWGAQENGMILYSMYFAWAFVGLFASLIKKVCRGNEIALGALFAGLGLLFFVTNLLSMIEIVRFGMEYYPVQ